MPIVPFTAAWLSRLTRKELSGSPVSDPSGNKVSVIIPAYNAELCLSRAVESALSQSCSPEIIIVDDGSFDATPKVASKFGKKIEYIRQENLGPSAARNTGVRFSSKEFIAFLDADDYWMPEFLNKCSNFLEKHTDCIAVSTGMIFKQRNLRVSLGPRFLLHRFESTASFVIKDFFAFWVDEDHVRTGSCVIRKSILLQAGLLREDLRAAEDLELWGLLATYGHWGFIPEFLWVCDSERQRDALSKHRRRLGFIPTVDSWETRIVPRLQNGQWAGFRRRRASLAVTFAYSAILAGESDRAYEIIKSYAPDMPRTLASRVMQAAAAHGKAVWMVFCTLIRARSRLSTLRQ